MNNSSHEMSEYITKVPKLPFYSGLLKSSQLLFGETGGDSFQCH